MSRRRSVKRSSTASPLRPGVLIRSRSMRSVAEEALGAYKDVTEVVDRAGLASPVARLEPVICVKG